MSFPGDETLLEQEGDLLEEARGPILECGCAGESDRQRRVAPLRAQHDAAVFRSRSPLPSRRQGEV